MRKTHPSRRDFLKEAALGGAAIATAAAGLKGQTSPEKKAPPPFKLKYAPPLGMFEWQAGKNPIDQLKFMAGQGFRAMFDNGLMGRPVADQEDIARESARLGLAIGPFVAYADFSVKTFVTKDKAVRDMMAGKLKTAVETAKRTGCQQTLVVPGRYDESLDWDYQTANVIENLKWCAGVVERAGLVIVIEPLNPKDHPGLFLTKMAQACQICRAVASPSLKINDDIYHQQITEGNIIPNIDACWDEIGAFHIGDTPGRKEPGTGELNYRNIFEHIHAKGFQGVLCMEHGKSKPGKEGEKAVIEAYRAADAF
ncbi:MAG: TIM barrel protein [Candidatus Aminicenantales bacterium]|jgi:hydroxypyruvate isomerase